MLIDPDALDRKGRYLLMTSGLIPRPIAWLSTISRAGRPNLAPFSFFAGIATTPPLVGVSIGSRRGTKKDSWANLEETGEAIIHIPTEDLAAAMVRTSGDYPEDVDEFELAGLAGVPGERVRALRIVSAPFAMEVEVERLLELGDPADPNGFAVCRIVLIHAQEDLLDQGRVVPERLQAVGRLGGASYCRVREIFQIPRPDTEGELRRYREGA